MNKRILVTYASRSGSTAETAEAISKILLQDGLQVDLLPMQEVKNLNPYVAVVLGSPIRKSQWLPEALRFVQDHRVELTRKRVAMFTLSITLAMSNSDQYRRAVGEWIAPVRSQVKPVSEGLFAGRLDFTKLPLNLDTLKMRLVVASGIFPKDDRRDWNAVRVWAEGLSPLLLQ
jgi:menaquinone-dependent protoporphyrinogen oxidase